MRNQYQNQANGDIRQWLKEDNIAFWRLAEKLGVSEGTVVRWLRTELSEQKKEKIIQSIEELRKEA